VKNQLALAKKEKKFRTVKEIGKAPSDLAELQERVDEAVKLKQQIHQLQEDIKGLRQGAVESLSIDPKMFNALVAMAYNNNFDQKKQECWNMEEAIDTITGGTAIASSADED